MSKQIIQGSLFNQCYNKFKMKPEVKVKIASWLLDPDHPQRLEKMPLETLEEELERQGLKKIFYELELPLVEILKNMRKIGIRVDLSILEKLGKELSKEIAALEKTIYREVGRPLNLNSPKQLSEVLYEKLKIDPAGVPRTKTGLRSTDAESLSLIQSRHSIVPLILNYRELFKIKSTYVEPLRALADKNSRVHTTFLQTGTATGRLSSQNPNLQNIPIMSEWGKKLRRAFIAEKNYSLVSFDYSQIELRILASVAGDPKMIEAFNQDLDIHVLTAANVYNVDIQKVTPEMRRLAKTLNFGVIYGMGPEAFARSSGLSREEAQTFIAEYFRDFREIKRWQEKVINQARQTGYVENLNGRRRLLENINSSNRRLAAGAERMAINMPIQGLAADIIKIAMIRVAELFQKEKWRLSKARMLLSIHDELLFEIADDILKKAMSLIQKEMESTFPLKVFLKVESTYGKNWAEL